RPSIIMARTKRRVKAAPRLERLESRTLLSLAATDLAYDTPAELAALGPTNSVIVQFANDAATQAAQSALDRSGAHIPQTWASGPSLIALGPDFDPTTALEQLREMPGILYAQPNGLIQIATTPNDPGYSQQYALNQSNNVDIDAPQAWDITTGSPSVLV